MRNRAPYIGLLVLSIPAIYWGYFILSNLPYHFKGVGPKDYIGALLGLALAATATYGLISGKPFANLPKLVRVFVLVAGIASSLFMAGFLLLLLLALNWN